MADVLLNFGIDPSSEGSIKAGLDRLLSKYTSQSPKIKVDVDTGATKTAYKEVVRLNNVIVETTKEIKRLQSGVNPNRNTYIDALTQELKQLERLKNDLRGDGSTPWKIVSQDNFNAELDKILAKISEIKGAFQTISGGDYMQKLGYGSTELTNKLKQVESMMRTVKAAQDDITAGKKIADPQTISGLEDLSGRLDRLFRSLEQGDMPVKEASEQIANIDRALANLKANVKNVDLSQQLLGSNPEKFTQMSSQVNTMQESVQKLQETLSKGGIASGATKAGIESLAAELQAFSREMQNMPTKQAEQKLAELQSRLTSLSGSVKTAGSIFKTMFGGFGAGVTQYVGMTLTWLRAIQWTVKEIKELINTAIELDDAFTQLKIVTGASDAEMEQFSGTLADTAKNMSASLTDLANVVTVYSRLGYTLDESNTLAKFTAMLQNVGDIDASAASDAVTAIVKAFHIDVSEIEGVMDDMVTVGNNFPISVSQIAEGMNNASSMMANAGMKFEEAVALLTAANTTVQNVSKSSTALRTIIARLRNVKSELDDAGEVWNEAKYQELVSALTKGGVQLQEATGALRNPYEVLSELAAKWSTLSTDVQAAIQTALAGTRQQDVFSSLMTQFQEATGAMEAMGESAGALTDAYAIFEDSMTGHLNKLKASFQDLAQTAVDKGFANSVIDMGTTIIEVLTPIADILGTITSALGPLGTAIAALGLGALISNLGKVFALYRRKPVLHKPSNCGETLTPFRHIGALTGRRDGAEKQKKVSGWPMLKHNATGCATMSNPQPSPSPLSGLRHVGICDEREGSQTVRWFAPRSVIYSRNCRRGFLCQAA